MQTRLLASVAGGIVGLGLALMVGDALGLSQAVIRGIGALGGLSVGYVGSIFFDLFTSEAGSMHTIPDRSAED